MYFLDRVSHFTATKRKKNKWTQQEMATHYNVDKNEIWRMENGTAETKLSKAIKVLDEYSKADNRNPGEFVNELLQKKNDGNISHLSQNEADILKAIQAVDPRARRKFASILSKTSTNKFEICMEFYEFPMPMLKNTLALLKNIIENDKI
jgi:transcriptional regulator with XRE-family HTH domain